MNTLMGSTQEWTQKHSENKVLALSLEILPQVVYPETRALHPGHQSVYTLKFKKVTLIIVPAHMCRGTLLK